MSNTSEVIKDVASYLPEGLDESTLEKVAGLISVTIKQKVQEEVQDLSNKVTSFIRGNVEKLKEQALKELELENETFRNAQMFESVRSMFAVELNAQDELNGLDALASIGEAQEEKNDALLRQLDKLLKENINLKRSVKLSSDKNIKLEESLGTVEKAARKLKENSNAERRLSDKALVISEDNFKVKEASEKLVENHAVHNEWINQGVIDKLNNNLRG
jgi:hypothetical protein|tara:strand:+ start:1522 stop:2175 length:654 start_codon:yes stop_codon:yes gene_type:complete